MTNENNYQGLVVKMQSRILNGEMKTLRDWAEEFQVPVDRLRNELSRCRNKRKNKIMLYPLPYLNGEPGYVVDITENSEHFRRVASNYDSRVIDHFLAGVSALEAGLKAHPEQFKYVMEEVNSLVAAFDDGRRTLLLKDKNV